ncbi:MAG: hypothetical protein AAF958_02810 [Planctomycetota bacterium]
MKRIAIFMAAAMWLTGLGNCQEAMGLTDPVGPANAGPASVGPAVGTGAVTSGTQLYPGEGGYFALPQETPIQTPSPVAQPMPLSTAPMSTGPMSTGPHLGSVPQQAATGPCVSNTNASGEMCPDHWTRFHAFLFRRYAGSVEMESKTRYPENYYGRYTYLEWHPDWVNTPANQLRKSQYRHHVVRPNDRIFTPQSTGPNWRVARQAALQSAAVPNRGQMSSGHVGETATRTVSRRTFPVWQGAAGEAAASGSSRDSDR